jgi:hypothetical protein
MLGASVRRSKYVPHSIVTTSPGTAREIAAWMDAASIGTRIVVAWETENTAAQQSGTT